MNPDLPAAETRRSRRALRDSKNQAVGTDPLPEERPTSRRARRLQAAETPIVSSPVTESLSFDEPLQMVTEAPQATPQQSAQRDEFAAAMASMNFTGEQVRVVDDGPAPFPTRRERVARHASLNTPFRRFAAATASVGAVVAVGLIAVGATLPFATGTGSATADIAAAEAEAVERAAAAQELPQADLQAYVAGENVETQALTRMEGYEAGLATPQFTYADASASMGISTANAVFENDVSADIQWPFATGTSMSSPFGMRWGRLHEGIDFTPGDGAPIQAIADGVVRTATEAGGAYGVNVYVDHVIDGQLVTSHYAHMQYGSLQVQAGDTVKVGDTLGLVGNTGRSYGAHLHFEVIVGGSTIDPMPWLQENGNRHYSSEEREQARAAIVSQLGGAQLAN